MENKIQSCETSLEKISIDETAIITLTVVDSSDPSTTPQGVQVFWAVSGPGTIKPKSSMTNDEGKAITTLTATGNGQITVTGTISDDTAGKSVNVTVEGNTMPNLVQSIIAVPDSIPSDESLFATVTAVVTDGSAPQQEVSVTWAANGGILDNESSTTDGEGKATVTLKANHDGLITVTATTIEDTTGKTTYVFASPALEAPTVLNASEADNYILNQYDIAVGVDAIIPLYANAEAGHILTFYWGTHQLQAAIQDPSSDLPMNIFITREMPPEALQDGSYQVYYQIRDQAGNISTSSALPITVQNGGETIPTLEAPEVPLADDGYINIDDAKVGVTATIRYEGMEENDQITFYWAAYDKQGRLINKASTSVPITIAAGDESHDVAIDIKLFFPNAGDSGYEGYVNAYYTVQKANTPNESLLLSSTKVCNVDTVAP